MFETWEAFYASRLQGVWLLVVPAAAFLVWLLAHGRPAAAGAEPRAARFVHVWTVVFTVGTILDPLLIVYAGVPMLPFVLLGDFRVFLLVLGVAHPMRPLAATVGLGRTRSHKMRIDLVRGAGGDLELKQANVQ